jgi:Prp19/Pso4-like
MYVAVIPTCILKISLSHSFSAPKTAAPRPPTHTSIPGLLHLLQNEWDALVLGTHALEQQYNATRQELSYALYAQDAASRVAARLLRERDAARECVNVFPSFQQELTLTKIGPLQMSKQAWASRLRPLAPMTSKCPRMEPQMQAFRPT